MIPSFTILSMQGIYTIHVSRLLKVLERNEYSKIFQRKKE